MTDDPIALLFGGMEKLGPGSDADTLHVLRLLPECDVRVVVDAGCGTGRQTMVLARELDALIHAVDAHEPFLNDLARRAGEAGVGARVQIHCMDMTDIPRVFSDVDLLWSEGAAYNIGFADALAAWASVVTAHGVVVVSELSWLVDRPPDEAVEFFRSCYPAMQSVAQNVAVAKAAGYEVLATHTVPPSAWTDGYYDVLAPRARALLDHADAAVRDVAGETVREIAVFARSEGSYGYVFYVLRGTGQVSP